MCPTRLFWFAVGAASAIWWEKHKEGHLHCTRSPSMQQASVNPSRGINASSAPPIQRDTLGLNDIAELRASAGDKLAELSESTLDTVLSTVEVLRAKLAEHRVDRQKEIEEERRRKEVLNIMPVASNWKT